MPTLVFGESGNITVTREDAAQLAALIPEATLVMLEDVGGLSAQAQPVIDFIASLDSIYVSRSEATDSPALSQREQDVLRLIVAGRSSREIGEALVLSVRTVERHIANIYLKTDTHGRAQVTAYALSRGIA